MERIAIVAATRTPIGKVGGTLINTEADELVRIVLEGVLEQVPFESDLIDEVIIGQAKQSTDQPNIARVGMLKAKWDEKIPAYSIHRQCASGMQAMFNGMQQIQTDNSNIVVTGGVESMSTAPFYIRNARFGVGSGNQQFLDPNVESQPRSQPQEIYGEFNMIQTAENVAEKYNITRTEQDEFAQRSQEQAAVAIDKGLFKEEITPVRIPRRKQDDLVFSEDEFPRRNSTLDGLSKLRPIFEGGTVTAGNATGRNDGACALILMKESMVKSLGLTPLAYILGATAVGLDPRYMGMGPWPASEKLMKKLQMKIEDFGLYEINEAFASQSVASMKQLKMDPDKLNVNGGAIALGHPLGCSGARISTTLIYEMIRRGTRYGLASICVAGGLGMAMAFENARV